MSAASSPRRVVGFAAVVPGYGCVSDRDESTREESYVEDADGGGSCSAGGGNSAGRRRNG
jgi:hypothetical protein